MAPATDWAINIWNTLTLSEENCLHCVAPEETPQSEESAPYWVTSAVLHELGHCALGLDHPNRNWDLADDGEHERTSFTRSWDAIDILVGSDGIRGSFDDFHDGLFGSIAESVSWFRKADNNPVVFDFTTIELSTFSRSVAANLPPETWAANAGRLVAASLGHGSTQSVMYTDQDRGMIHDSLSADDSNMMEMARTGVDLAAGTGDDYTVTLVRVDCSEAHDIEVLHEALGVEDAPIATCQAAVDYAYAQSPATARVYKLVLGGLSALKVRVNSDLPLSYSIPIFVDGFESTSTSAWSSEEQ